MSANSEALTYAPECVDVLLANARVDAPWRDAFQIPEPSTQLSQAIYFMRRAVRTVSYSEGLPTLDPLKISWPEDRVGVCGLEMLVYRVLQSMLEQLRTRQ